MSVLRVGRYVVCDEIASGGMATVHYGRVLGEGGFSRIVAVKRLHEMYAKDPDFVAMFMDEARIAARIQHPNVVSTIDVVSSEGVLLLVMEYLHGEALSRVLRFADRDGEQVPLDIASAILCDALHGLHAAHEATNEAGEPLHLVHRDVSPQNLLVGAEGITRVVDFGIAKAVGQVHTTREGQLKGKIAYMSPEQIVAGAVDRRADVYAAGVVLWETLARRSLFAAPNEVATLHNVLERAVEPPSAFRGEVPRKLDDVVMCALSRTAASRFATARDMAQALEAAVKVASPRRVAEWVETLAGDRLVQRRHRLGELERAPVPPEIATSPQIDTSAISLPAAPPPRSRAWMVAAAGALIVAALAGARAVTGGDASATPAPAASLPAAAPTATPPRAIAGPAPTAEAPPVASASPTVDAQPSAAPEATRTRSRRRPEVKPSPVASANCAVRSYVDADGITQFRRECR